MVTATLIKKGYKQTDLGVVIPEDWDLRKLKAIAEVKTGPFGSSLHQKDYVNDGTPIITVEHLGEHGLVHRNLPMVSDHDKKRLSSYWLQTGDIVFSRVGSVDRNSLVKEIENGWLFSGRLLRIRLNPKEVCPAFLSYYFHQEPTKQRIRSVAVGQTMASLNTKILKDVEVILPPTRTEQTAIATVLSDTDALIEHMEKLIAKKEAIKHGAMQELLTGKKRLPGFSGKWEVKKLGVICYFDKGVQVNRSKLAKTGKYPVLNGGIEPSGYSEQWNTEGKTITISEGGNSCGFVNFSIQRFWCGGHCYAVKIIDKNVNLLFLYQKLKHNEENIMSLRVGSGLPNIQKKSLLNFELEIPIYFEEQTAIAIVLNDMDDEIEQLEQKRDKYKMIKQGMMQELLTGKIRLV